MVRAGRLLGGVIVAAVIFLGARTDRAGRATSGAAPDETVDIVILYENDRHGQLTPMFDLWTRPQSPRQLGGIGGFFALIEEFRAKHENVLLLSAGDSSFGSFSAAASRGRTSIEFMNAARFDAAVIGNHELDYGIAAFERIAADATFPILGANVIPESGLGPRPSQVVLAIAGLRVGILGACTDDRNLPTSRDLENVRLFGDPTPHLIEAARSPAFRSADIRIVLNHIEWPKNQQLIDGGLIADIVIGGHRHEQVLAAPRRTRNGALICQGGPLGAALGVLEVRYSKQSKKIVAATGYLREIEVMPETNVPESLRRTLSEVRTRGDRPVGEASASTLEETRRFFADALRQATGAQIVGYDDKTVVAPLGSGPMTRRRLWVSAPGCDGGFVVVRMRRADMDRLSTEGASLLLFDAAVGSDREEFVRACIPKSDYFAVRTDLDDHEVVRAIDDSLAFIAADVMESRAQTRDTR